MLRSRFVRALLPLALAFALGCPVGDPVQAQADQVLGAELCAAAQGVIPAGSRIALAPPRASESPVPVAEIEAIMSRAAQEMCADWADKPRILAGSAELRASLALVQARQGAEAWREAVQATVRQEADYVLVGEAAMAGDQIVLRLTLVDLEDGRVLVKTSDAVLTGIGRQVAGDPRATILTAVAEIIDSLPAAREEVTVGRFINETSGVETALGRILADMAVEAWLDSANSVTALLRDAPPARVKVGPPPASGFYLDGTVRLVDGNRFQLVLRLRQDGALRATRTLDLSALQLPPHLRELADPGRMLAPRGLAQVEEDLSRLGTLRMTVAAQGGVGGRYPICRATDASRLLTDCASSLIRVVVAADAAGPLICFSLDDAGQFFVMLPSDYAPDPYLPSAGALTLPDDLPALADGNRVYWPAMGPPAETLVGCVLYAGSTVATLDRLKALDGRLLSVSEQTVLLSILRDSAPLAANGTRVRIVE